MGKVRDLERAKVERLARSILPALRDRGSAHRRTDELEDVELWRRAARRAGRLLGWRTRTGLTDDGSVVRAVALDFTATEREVREAGARVTALVLGRRRPGDADETSPR